MTGSRAGRWLGIALTTYAVAVFVVMWIGVALVLTVRPTTFDDAWIWLQSLPVLPQVVAWIAVLPIAVGLWVVHTDMPELVRVVAVVGLIAWTMLPISSIVASARRHQGASQA